MKPRAPTRTAFRPSPLRWAIGLLPIVAALGAGWAADPPKRVLILDSFGRDSAPWSYSTPVIKTELAWQLSTPIEVHEVSVEDSRFGDTKAQAAFIEYLRALFHSRSPDLVVPVGGQAARFWTDHRQALFPSTPVVFGAIDARLVETVRPSTNDAVVAFKLDLSAAIEIMLEVLPDTTNVAVVFGDSPLERFWRAQCRQAWAPFTNRLHFTWFEGMSFEDICVRAAHLPPRSAVGYGLLAVDAAGIPHTEPQVVRRLSAVANAPVFGLYEEQLGHGIIGGRLISGASLGRAAGQIGARILQGEPPAAIAPWGASAGPPTFDWRELHRWGIPNRQLPPGSVVRFQPPSVWERYRWFILAALSVMLAQAATIAAMLLQRTWRRRAETSAYALSGRLITAQEDERRRIARDLHDDLNQRLALLSLELDLAGRGDGRSGLRPTLDALAGQVKDLSSDVHELSYRLHPAKLDQLGLVTAAQALCNELSAQSGLRIRFTHGEIPRGVPMETSLCVYRVLQEALGNAIAHSHAAQACADLDMSDSRLCLTVSDDGCGFDPVQARRADRLGLLCMEERARLAQGQLEIRSGPGRGTIIELTVPIRARNGASGDGA